MASAMFRARILSHVSRIKNPNRRFLNSNAGKDPAISTQSSPIADQAAPAAASTATAAAAAAEGPAAAAQASEAVSAGAAAQASEAVSAGVAALASEAASGGASGSGSGKKPWNFLMYSLIGALTGATGYVGYATYAYSLDEVAEKTKALRESPYASAPPEDASVIEKFQFKAYSTAMTGTAKAVELYIDLRRMIEEHLKDYTEPASDKLLPDLHPSEQHVFTLVLDLNETILYSDWKRERGWRTFKRPGIDAFLQHLGRFYEIVVYSDQMNMYVDPVVERLDTNHFIRYRLSRTATKYQDGKHYRDLSKLNRDPAKILYLSAHAFESCLQPENAIPIKPFITDGESQAEEAELDTALLDLIPFLEYVARVSPADIRTVLASYEKKDVAKEFLERSKEYQKRMQEQRHGFRLWGR
ncbi:mitochondrial inner membrane protein required for protein import [Turnera subulata]|uniref:Mitochondrial import inner membrane translocase subunit TIM50 n=1 Tax=Turnera subulata TaxID=218843 RepID=A0A9Q0J3W9_9ROSI|nr:mitochondrial inner membrane protein required for protein import [Turnera subulata]